MRTVKNDTRKRRKRQKRRETLDTDNQQYILTRIRRTTRSLSSLKIKSKRAVFVDKKRAEEKDALFFLKIWDSRCDSNETTDSLIQGAQTRTPTWRLHRVIYNSAPSSAHHQYWYRERRAKLRLGRKQKDMRWIKWKKRSQMAEKICVRIYTEKKRMIYHAKILRLS